MTLGMQNSINIAVLTVFHTVHTLILCFVALSHTCLIQIAVRVLDTAADALKTWELRATGFFLTPPEYTVMLSTLEGLVDLQATAWGGHPEVNFRKFLFIYDLYNLIALCILCCIH